jgi:hypothetical protein
VLWNIYFAYFHSRLKYGIILWGGRRESIKILRIQKKVIRLMKMMTINPGKSEAIRFRRAQVKNPLGYYLGDQKLLEATRCKYL